MNLKLDRPLNLQDDVRLCSDSTVMTSKDAHTILNFILTFPIPDKEKDQFKEILKNTQFELTHLIFIANLLNVDFELFYYKSFCLDAMINQLILKDCTLDQILPYQYRVNKNSSTTSLVSILNQFSNDQLKHSIYRKLQIPFHYFDEHRPLSVLAIRDALGFLYPHIENQELHFAAFENCEKFMNSHFGKAIKGENTLKEIYESSFASSKLIEKSWNYEILKADSSGISVLSKQSQDGTYTNYLTSLCRIKFIESIGNFCGHQGIYTSEFRQTDEDEIVFEVNFDKAKRFF